MKSLHDYKGEMRAAGKRYRRALNAWSASLGGPFTQEKKNALLQQTLTHRKELDAKLCALSFAREVAYQKNWGRT